MKKAPKSIVIAGKRIKLAHLRTSGKGAEVVGARVHIKGLGTVYVQVYEAFEAAAHAMNSAEPTPPGVTPVAHSPSTGSGNSHERQATPLDAMLVETLRAMNDRMKRLENRAVILPEGAIPPPRPSNGHPR